MSDVLVSDVLPAVKDYARNQNLSDARGIRALNAAIRFIASDLGLPGHEREFQFEFFEDQPTYSPPSDFGEPLSLRFLDDKLNRSSRFTYRPSEFLFERVSAIDPNTRLWGRYDASSSPLLYVLTKNTAAGIFIDSFDQNNATNWVPSNDATNVGTDTVVFWEGIASMSFDVDVSLSGLNRATLSRTFSSPFDLSTMQNIGHAKFDLDIPSVTNFTSVTLAWETDGSNYYFNTVNTQEDGSPFVVGRNKINIPWEGASIVGMPTASSINTIVFNLDYAAGYTDQVSFHIDNLRFEKPDEMVMTYYTNNVGKDADGTYISKLSATTDKFLFGPFDPALQELVAIQAGIYLNPQLLVDDAQVRRQYETFRKTYAKKYPKKRVNNLIAAPATPRTSRQSP